MAFKSKRGTVLRPEELQGKHPRYSGYGKDAEELFIPSNKSKSVQNSRPTYESNQWCAAPSAILSVFSEPDNSPYKQNLWQLFIYGCIWLSAVFFYNNQALPENVFVDENNKPIKSKTRIEHAKRFLALKQQQFHTQFMACLLQNKHHFIFTRKDKIYWKKVDIEVDKLTYPIFPSAEQIILGASKVNKDDKVDIKLGFNISQSIHLNLIYLKLIYLNLIHLNLGIHIIFIDF